MFVLFTYIFDFCFFKKLLFLGFLLANSQGWKHVRVCVCLTRDAHTNDEFTHSHNVKSDH